MYKSWGMLVIESVMEDQSEDQNWICSKIFDEQDWKEELENKSSNAIL